MAVLEYHSFSITDIVTEIASIFAPFLAEIASIFASINPKIALVITNFTANFSPFCRGICMSHGSTIFSHLSAQVTFVRASFLAKILPILVAVNTMLANFGAG